MKFAYTLIMGALLAAPAMAQECDANMANTAPNGRFAKFDSGIVKDLKTGLTWMRCQLGESWDATEKRCTGEASGMLWPAALSEVAAINGSDTHKLHKFGGVAKWRLPSIKELVSLKEVACHYPAINTQAFPGAVKHEPGVTEITLWSATPAGNGANVFAFDSGDGLVLAQDPTFDQAQYGVLLVAEE